MAKDFLTNDNLELIIRNGNFVIGESVEQEVNYIVLSNKGQFYKKPLLGVGVNKELNSTGRLIGIKQDIRNEIISDGIKVNKLDVARSEEGDMQIFIDSQR